VLLASNHLASLDTVIIPTSATRPVQFLIKSSYFTGSGILGRFKRWFFTSIGGVPVYRAAGRDARAALDAGSGILRAGSVFAVFPEGTRSRDGKLHQGHGGAAWMARDTGAAVVPVGLIGTGTAKPFSHLLPGRPRLEVRFGKPLDLSDLEGVPDGKARREITERMMSAIAALTGQERSGTVNATSRD
jgi:1-acyl-sn-glycerol-3-phosphate acyltransferase